MAEDPSPASNSSTINPSMEQLITKYSALSKQDPDKSDTWTPLHKDDWTRIYRCYETKDEVVTDTLVAIALIESVTAGEMANIFHSQDLKLQWDHSVDHSTLLETKSDNLAVYHQVTKRIWPAAQRDFVYESYKQSIPGEDPAHPDWIVCNISCEHPDATAEKSKYCRATVEIVFYCKTIVEGDPTSRENIKCKIFYSSTIDPGGWVPSAAVKIAATREYCKFLKQIGTFAQEYAKDHKIEY